MTYTEVCGIRKRAFLTILAPGPDGVMRRLVLLRNFPVARRRPILPGALTTRQPRGGLPHRGPNFGGQPFKSIGQENLLYALVAGPGAAWADRWNSSAKNELRLAAIRNAAPSRGRTPEQLNRDLKEIRQFGYPTTFDMILGNVRPASERIKSDFADAGAKIKQWYNDNITEPIYNTLYGGLNSSAPTNGNKRMQPKPWYKFW